MEINKAIEKMEKYVWEKLFYPETNLIYDLRTTLEPDGNISDLPTPEEISRNFPNACGWNTGMENSMINAGLMLDAVLNCYAKTGNNEMESLADKLFDGIKKCAEISGSEGFLARSTTFACTIFLCPPVRDLQDVLPTTGKMAVQDMVSSILPPGPCLFHSPGVILQPGQDPLYFCPRGCSIC